MLDEPFEGRPYGAQPLHEAGRLFVPTNERITFSLSCTVWDVRKDSFQRLCEVLRILLGDLLPVWRIVAAVVTPGIELEVFRVRGTCAGSFQPYRCATSSSVSQTLPGTLNSPHSPQMLTDSNGSLFLSSGSRIGIYSPFVTPR